MATYKKLTKDNNKVQVESAIRDGEGKVIANNYVKHNTYDETLSVGLSDNLKSQIVNVDREPYSFRTTGGNADVGNRKKVLKIVANTVKVDNALITTDISKMVNVGYNAYDNTHSTDFIKVIGGLKYTLEGTYTSVELYDINKTLLSETFVSEQALPESCAFVKIVGGNNTTCLHLTWSGSRTGYEPYVKHEYPVSFTGYGVNGVGDELYPDGHIVRKFGKYTFTGNESWVDWDGAGYSLATTIPSMKGYESSAIANVVWELGVTVKAGSRSPNFPEYTICVNQVGRLFVMTTKNATQLNSALAGKTIYFELASYTTEQGTPFESEQIVDDYGTEEFVSNNGIPTPVGHETNYQINLQNFLQRTYQKVSGDVDSFVLTNSGLLLPSSSGLDPTKSYTLKIVNGVKTWVEDI